MNSKAEVNTDRNIKNQLKKNLNNENIIKQVTEANDNLSVIDIRKRDFYEIKEINNTKNISNRKISDYENKNMGILDYIQNSPKLNLEVNKILIKKGRKF